MNEKAELAKNMGFATLARFFVGIVGIVTLVFLTRFLGPEGFGNYNTILAYVFIFMAFADFGLYSIFVREISRPGADEQYIGGNIFTLRIFVSILFAFVAVLISYFLPYEPVIRKGIMVATGFLVLSSFSQFFIGVFQKHLRIYYVSIADFAAKLTQLGLVIFFINSKLSLISFIWAVVLSEVIHFSIIYYFAQKLSKIPFLFDFKYWKKVLRISLPVAASIVLTLIYFKIDTVLLSLLKPAEDVGIYSVAYRVLEQAIFLPAIYIGMVMPMLSKHYSNKSKFAEIFDRSFNDLVSFAVPAVIFLFLLSSRIIGLIGGESFVISSDVLRILSFSVGIIFLGNLGGNALIALDLQKKGMWVFLSGAVINIAANFIFIPRYTYFGAAWTTLITEILVTIMMFYIIFNHRKIKINLFKTKRILLSGLVMALAVYPFRNLNLLISVPIGAVVYLASLYISKAITKEELMEVLSRRSSV